MTRTAVPGDTFGLLFRLTGGVRDDDVPDDAPGWRLMEATAEGEPTGKVVHGLHEDLLGMDPSGREGQDLF